jgi:hypothetical protein
VAEEHRRERELARGEFYVAIAHSRAPSEQVENHLAGPMFVRLGARRTNSLADLECCPTDVAKAIDDYGRRAPHDTFILPLDVRTARSSASGADVVSACAGLVASAPKDVCRAGGGLFETLV